MVKQSTRIKPWSGLMVSMFCYYFFMVVLATMLITSSHNFLLVKKFSDILSHNLAIYDKSPWSKVGFRKGCFVFRYMLGAYYNIRLWNYIDFKIFRNQQFENHFNWRFDVSCCQFSLCIVRILFERIPEL